MNFKKLAQSVTVDFSHNYNVSDMLKAGYAFLGPALDGGRAYWNDEGEPLSCSLSDLALLGRLILDGSDDPYSDWLATGAADSAELPEGFGEEEE